MSWIGVGVAAGSIVGGALSAQGAKSAANTQAQAAQQATGEQAREFDITQQNLQPWLTAGTSAVGKLSDLTGLSGTTMTPDQIMAMDPGYQFRLQQGNQGITNAAKAAGMYYSPATVKALTRYGQDYASNEFGNVYNRLAGISGTGQTTGSTLGGLGMQNAQNIGQLITGAANARGAAQIAGANAYGGAANSIGNALIWQKLMGGSPNTTNPSALMYNGQQWGGTASSPWYG